MIVILEGVNRTGKTTIANELTKLGYTYFKDLNVEEVINDKTINKKSFYKGRIIATVEFLQYIKINLIIDRYHYSEFVYGLIRRNYIADYILSIDKILATLNTKLILMDDDIEKINERAKKDLTIEKKAFDVIYEASILDKMRFNLKDSKDDLVKWLKYGSIKNELEVVK